MTDAEQPVADTQDSQPQSEPVQKTEKKVETVDGADADEDADYIENNKKLYAEKSFFTDEYLKCLDYPDVACMSCFCGCCVMGLNNALIVEPENRVVNCLIGIFLGCCCCGLIRSEIQKTVGVDDDGLPWNCFMHLCICCNVCSLVQEYRSIIRWKKATDQKFKEKYAKKKMMWGNTDAYFY